MIDLVTSKAENSITIFEVKNLGMLEDILRINHIFCDKTGALTKN